MRPPGYAGRVKSLRWIAAGVTTTALALTLSGAQSPAFTRPGAIAVTDFIGEVKAVTGTEEKVVTLEDKLRAEVTFKTPVRSTVDVLLSNGISLHIGSDSEMAVEEFWQDPHSPTFDPAQATEEPSRSQTRIRLVRGDVTATVKPLKVSRGSSFRLESVAGTLRCPGGTFRAQVLMTQLGIGVFNLELREGTAVFEPVDGKPTPLRIDRPLALAVEVDRAGKVKLSEIPKPKE